MSGGGGWGSGVRVDSGYRELEKGKKTNTPTSCSTKCLKGVELTSSKKR
jgi:hypothetical protein